MATKKIQILDSLNKNSVQYTSQVLTEEEKAQARENISASEIGHTHTAAELGGIEWKDVENKPFYEEGVSVTWNGDPNSAIDCLDYSSILGAMLCKVSDYIPKDTFVGGSVKAKMSDGSANEVAIVSEMFIDVNAICSLMITPDGMVLAAFISQGGEVDLTPLGLTGVVLEFPIENGAGIWALKTSDYYVSNFWGNDYIVKQIDKRFIPDISSLPQVTSSDDGKFLRVENGQWAVSAIPSAEGSYF